MWLTENLVDQQHVKHNPVWVRSTGNPDRFGRTIDNINDGKATIWVTGCPGTAELEWIPSWGDVFFEDDAGLYGAGG